jgi:hypothetical protein
VETTTEILALGAAACAIAALLILFRIHLLPGGRAWPPDTLSNVGAGPYHRYYRAMVLLLGASAGLLIAALHRGTEAETLGLTFLGVYAAARVAIAFVMTDPADGQVSPTGRLHMMLGAIAFVAIAFGAADITNAIEDTPGWSDGAGAVLRVASDAIGVSAVLALAAYAIPLARERAFTVAERLLYLSSIAWLLVASAHLGTLAAGG